VSVDGFYGFLTRLVAAWIALFLLYAGLLKAYGAFDLILRLAVRSAKYVDSGIAQTAVVASAVIGSVNGSQTANAGMTGSFTIPLMKENGIKPETAGGIEAVASTSGQVLPPVMGAGAFIMASLITGITYVDVIIAGLIPAAILVVSITIAVHYVAAPQIENPEMDGLIGEAMDRRTMVLESVKYGVPLLILIYILGVLQYTVMTAALYTAVSMIAFGIGIPQIQATLDGESNTEALFGTLEQTIDGFREGVIVVAPVTIILAAINGVVDILMATGVPTAISLTLLDLSGGIPIIAFVLAMIICIILGLGMPTTAAYTVVALLVAPTLISQFLVPELAAHFFVFPSRSSTTRSSSPARSATRPSRPAPSRWSVRWRSSTGSTTSSSSVAGRRTASGSPSSSPAWWRWSTRCRPSRSERSRRSARCTSSRPPWGGRTRSARSAARRECSPAGSGRRRRGRRPFYSQYDRGSPSTRSPR